MCISCSREFDGTCRPPSNFISSSGLSRHLDASMNKSDPMWIERCTSTHSMENIPKGLQENCFLRYASLGLVKEDLTTYDFSSSLVSNNKRPFQMPPTELQDLPATKELGYNPFNLLPPTSKKNTLPAHISAFQLTTIQDIASRSRAAPPLSKEAMADFLKQQSAKPPPMASVDVTSHADDGDVDNISNAMDSLSITNPPSHSAQEEPTTKVRSDFMDLLEYHANTSNPEIVKDSRLKCELSLLQLGLKHRWPMKAYRDVMQWAKDSVRQIPSFFEYPFRSRETVIHECRCASGTIGDNEFTERIILWQPQNKPTVLYHRPILRCIFDILTDMSVLGSEGCNLSLPHPTNPYEPAPDVPPEFVTELHHGVWWTDTMREYCTGKYEILVPLIFAIDESNTDSNDRLNVCPLLVTLGILDKKTRAAAKSWRVVAHILDEKIESHDEVDETDTKDKLQNLHNQLSIALEDLRNLHENGESIEWELEYHGQRYPVHLKFAIAYVISDTQMHDKLCGRYGNWQCRRPCRHCNIQKEFLIDVDMFKKVSLWTPAEFDPNVRSFYRDADHFQNRSHHPINNAFDPLYFGTNDKKIHFATPPEPLHCIEKGCQERCVQALKYIINYPTTVEYAENRKAADVHLRNSTFVIKRLEACGKSIGNQLTRQSDRDKPRTVFGNKLFDDSLKFAREQSGVVLCLLITMVSDLGRRLLLEERGLDPVYLQMQVHVFERVLMIDEWLKQESFPRELAEDEGRILSAVYDVVRLIKKTCARGGAGSNLIKNHHLMHFAKYIDMFGPPIGWDSGHIESFHKLFSKLPAKMTSRIRRIFSQQLASRQSENEVVSRSNLYANADFKIKRTRSSPEGGSYFHFVTGDGTATIEWSDKSHNSGKPVHFQEVSHYVYQIFKDHVGSMESIRGFTEFNVQIDNRDAKFRAHPSYRSHSGQECNVWYDWAKIMTPGGAIVPARIFMFLTEPKWLTDPIVDHALLSHDIHNDSGPLAVVQSFEGEPTNRFRPSLVDSIEIDGGGTHDSPYCTLIEHGRLLPDLDIIPVSAIVDTVIVIPNPPYKYDEKLKKAHFKAAREENYSEPLGEDEHGQMGWFVIKPRREWAAEFQKLIQAYPPTPFE